MDKNLIKKYEKLKKNLLNLGFLCVGSVSSVYRPCGKLNCRCHSDTEFRHGPYYQWTRKIKGKTVSRFLNEQDAQECLAWIANQRKLEAIIKEMQDLSKRAAEWYR